MVEYNASGSNIFLGVSLSSLEAEANIRIQRAPVSLDLVDIDLPCIPTLAGLKSLCPVGEVRL